MDEGRVREIVDAAIADRVPRAIEVNLSDGRAIKVEGRVHKRFDDVLGFVNEGHHNILMVGPSGCGKTILAKHIAEALGIDFGFLSLSAGVTETHLFGRILPQADGTWDYVPRLCLINAQSADNQEQRPTWGRPDPGRRHGCDETN